MDVTQSWSYNPDNTKGNVSTSEWNETLVASIIDCINQIQKVTFAKYGRAARSAINVYACQDVCLMLQTSKLFTPADKSVVQTDPASQPFGKIADFLIHKDKILQRDRVRILVNFNVGEEADASMFGDVHIIDMPKVIQRA